MLGPARAGGAERHEPLSRRGARAGSSARPTVTKLPRAATREPACGNCSALAGRGGGPCVPEWVPPACPLGAGPHLPLETLPGAPFASFGSGKAKEFASYGKEHTGQLSQAWARGACSQARCCCCSAARGRALRLLRPRGGASARRGARGAPWPRSWAWGRCDATRARRARLLFFPLLRRLRQCFAPGPQPGRATDTYDRVCPDAAPRFRAGALRWARVALGAGVPLL